ncbi:hypothetical protein BATDEDRAFT_90085 [Batrachochytrium dendrobatidis JAM81]|uniref:50S ribosomal protein L9, chloroplastic n=2 Tax=Batrachochytrium dendrobatidis TaxID=109871 RepID=F4P7F4_BATDJ|nr:uncharacterized protein BATDEDRAFT_90085 [Batrachochytrium dendrobatidis JAM81]EGF79096.1 hypothetical protein BATDEDRAFT_90085 [Batrachochytrium dendrobatidis JAM81]KAJ8325188.1 hypothetical protein O5D80_006138 [Batrachochytrium dendrobatidis]KAK5667345.1 hypothetical protein QVD99_005951 [Batrachochytrium dendrobatidis]OAJ42188.1 ribosomal protein L9 [Batrachochytrium dendrobatidis JEL423]|eukprot:XP_006680573.1 hypothetical protein BATDEDRAFT_90085 [Batrachochytrium dendrobatidis JAM81]
MSLSPMVRQSITAICTTRPLLALSHQSQIRCKFSKPDLHVYLLEDVKGLGKRGEIVQAAPKTVRNYLVPFKLAYYLPRFNDQPVLPENWIPNTNEQELDIEVISPAFSTVIYNESAPQTVLSPVADITMGPVRSAAQKELVEKEYEQHDSENRIALLSLDRLVFHRVRISPDSDKIFGSVSPYDISLLLDQSHSIRVNRDLIIIKSQKIKHIGEHDVEIQFGSGLQPVQIKAVIEELK